MSLEKLVYMANQIGKFFASQGTGASRGRDGRSHPEILGPAYARERSRRIWTQGAPAWIRLRVSRVERSEGCTKEET